MGSQAVTKLRPAPHNKITAQAQVYVHTTSGIRTHDPSIRAVFERPEPVTGTVHQATQRLPESFLAQTERQTTPDKRCP